jgi:hypothetical protein
LQFNQVKRLFNFYLFGCFKRYSLNVSRNHTRYKKAAYIDDIGEESIDEIKLAIS